MYLLVPINLSADYKLPSGPSFLLDNPPKLHLSPLTGEGFTDVKKINPIFKCQSDKILVHLTVLTAKCFQTPQSNVRYLKFQFQLNHNIR